jgi:hypothetical protein
MFFLALFRVGMVFSVPCGALKLIVMASFVVANWVTAFAFAGVPVPRATFNFRPEPGVQDLQELAVSHHRSILCHLPLVPQAFPRERWPLWTLVEDARSQDGSAILSPRPNLELSARPIAGSPFQVQSKELEESSFTDESMVSMKP